MVSARLFILVLAAVFVSVSCQTGSPGRSGDLTGGELVLHQDITVAGGRSHIVFQSGAISGAVNEYYPHCELELRQVREQSQRVLADTFRITRVLGQTHYVLRPDVPVLLAAVGRYHWLASDSSEWIMLAYHFSLHSDAQPNVATLVCGGAYDYPYYARYPELEEMREALGDGATLLLP